MNIGRTPARNRPDFWGEGRAWLSIADMNQGRTLRTTKESITTAAIDECKCKEVEAGTVLLSFKLSIGKVGITEVPLFTNEAIAALPIQDRRRLSAEYLYWALQSIDLTLGLDRAAKGLTLNKAKLLEIPIPLPSLVEQRRIADVLDRAEALRAKRRAALAQLDTLTQSLFLNLFGDPSGDTMGVSIEPLGDHLTFVTSGGRGWAEFYASSGSRFIRSLDVQMNQIGDEDIAFVVPPDNAEARRTRAVTGDVLLTITGSRIGRVAPLPAELDGSYVSQHVAILRANRRRLDPIFLSFFLSFETGGQRQIAKAQYGQTKPGLNFEQIRRFQVPIPPLPQQHDFARRVAVVEKLKTAHRASLAELDALFATLQHHAFRGEL